MTERKVVLLGRVNAGKSTLFNRLVGERRALVADFPGLTRDRRLGHVVLPEGRLSIIDTAGLDSPLKGSEELEKLARKETEKALEEAEAVWFLVDGKVGGSTLEEEWCKKLRRLKKPFWLVVNKMDNPKKIQEALEYHRYGVERVHALSSLHGHGVSALLESTFEVLGGEERGILQPKEGALGEKDLEQAALKGKELEEEELGKHEKAEDSTAPKVVWLGKPNVGKSSLINCILGQERLVVSPQAGTTRESLEIPWEGKAGNYLLTDTAGIRRRSKTQEYVEKLGILQSLTSLRRADVAVLVLDATKEVSHQDARLAGYILRSKAAMVLVWNKWDVLKNPKDRKAYTSEVQRRLSFLPSLDGHPCSAITGNGVPKVVQAIQQALEANQKHISTALLNKILNKATLAHTPPRIRNTATKIFYATQLGTSPPVFGLFTNRPKDMPASYSRYIESCFRRGLNLGSAPLKIVWKEK